jgi:hypothetical protein
MSNESLFINSVCLSYPPRIKYGVNSAEYPDVVPAEAGNHLKHWIPVFTGMTKKDDYGIYGQTLIRKYPLNTSSPRWERGRVRGNFKYFWL